MFLSEAIQSHPIACPRQPWATLASLLAQRPARPVDKLLVIRLDGLGDVLLMLPWLTSLRGRHPQLKICVLVREHAAEVVRHCAAADQVVAWPTHVTKASLIKRALSELRHRQFDAAIVPRVGRDHYSAKWVALLSGAPLRLGFGEHAMVGGCSPRPDAFLTHIVDTPHGLHEAQVPYLLLGESPPAPDDLRITVALTAGEEALADVLLSDPTRRWFAIAPGAREAKRRWPPERFAAVALHLVNQGYQPLMVGGNDAKPAAAAIGRLCPTALDLTGRLSVPQVVAVLRRSVLVLTNDSAPAHLASAADTPAVVVSCHPSCGDPEGDNSPNRFRPLGATHVVLQPRGATPCTNACVARRPHCILGVDPNAVTIAATALLRTTTSGRFESNP